MLETGRKLAQRTANLQLSRLRARLRERYFVEDDQLRPVERFVERRRERRLAIAERMPSRPADALRLFTLNIAHGRRRVPHQALVPSQRVRRNIGEVGQLIERLEADIVALQEADGPSVWSGNFDHVATVAKASNLQAHFRGEHNPFRVGRHNLASGTALLTRWPLDEARSHRFASSWRCTKGFVAAHVEVPRWGDVSVDVVSVHLDFLLPDVRRRQIRAMIDELGERRADRPLVVLGDLNCCWQQEPKSLRLLTRRLGLHAHAPNGGTATYPAYRPRRRLDWILISPHLRFTAHHLLPVKLSDHLAVLADVELVDGP